ncbi:MAG: NAD-glutamate dehydrogenase, partial [Propionivibrio sp.]|nr:NAD-glutamate dehydrogenase [Propionivibrio sp.]
QARYANAMHRHPLKREIVATVPLAMINHVGIVFVFRMCDETGAEAHGSGSRLFSGARHIRLPALWAEIEALDAQVAAPVQNRMLIDAGRLVLRTVLWFLRTRHGKLPFSEIIELFRPGVAQLGSKLSAFERRRFECA